MPTKQIIEGGRSFRIRPQTELGTAVAEAPRLWRWPIWPSVHKAPRQDSYDVKIWRRGPPEF